MADINTVLMQGNLTHDPYYDLVPPMDLPFMRFYLAVSLPNGLALVTLKGHVSQAPYFDRVGDSERPFMRLHLAVNRPPHRREPANPDVRRPSADFLRVVVYDDAALFTYPYLCAGSEVLVTGGLRGRKRRVGRGKTETVVEVVANDVTFMHNIDWERGDAERKRILAERETSPRDEKRPKPGRHGGGFFRVVCFGDLAQFSYPYLGVGSEVFVRGRLRRRKRELPDGKRQAVVEVVAQNIRFLRNIDWERGDSERDRILAERAALPEVTE